MSSHKILKPTSKAKVITLEMSQDVENMNQYSNRSTKDQTKDLQISKYENMVKTVNDEFQLAVKKNSDLSKQIFDLEYKLDRTNQELSKAQNYIDAEQKAKEDTNAAIEIEKWLWKKQNQNLRKELAKKNDEISKLKSIQFDLENKIIVNQSESGQSIKSETEIKSKIDQVVQKYGDLDLKIREKDSELYKTNSINEALRRDLEKAHQSEIKFDYDFNLVASENRNFKQENESLKEKLLKSGTILKQTFSESEDLKREISMIRNTSDLNKLTERNLHDDKYLLKSKIQKLDNENSLLENKVYKLSNKQDDVLENLLSLKRTIQSGLLDQTVVLKNLGYVINNLEHDTEISHFPKNKSYDESSLILTDMRLNSTRVHVEPIIERPQVAYNSPIFSKFK
jgi:chromosome segregation ATPase